MVYPNIESRSAAQQVATTTEFLAAIFMHLSILDLLHVKQVCRQWCDCVRDLSELQPALYKRATPVKSGDNPHFKPLDEALAAEKSRGGQTFGEMFIKIGHDLERRLDLLVGSGTADGKTFDNQSGWLRQLDHYKTAFNMIILCHHRTPHGPNPSISLHSAAPRAMPEMGGVHCGKCHTFHFSFQWDNLHPMLRFLKHTPFLCIDGYNSTIDIRLIGPNLPYSTDIEPKYQVFQTAMDLAEQVEDVDSICTTSGLKHDIGIQPSGLRLSAAVGHSPHHSSTGTLRRSGLLIGDFLEGLMWCTRKLALDVQTDTRGVLNFIVGSTERGLKAAEDPIEPNALAEAQARVTAMNERIAVMEARSALWRQAQRGTGPLGSRFGTL